MYLEDVKSNTKNKKRSPNTYHERLHHGLPFMYLKQEDKI